MGYECFSLFEVEARVDIAALKGFRVAIRVNSSIKVRHIL